MDVEHRLKLLVRGLLDDVVPRIARVIDDNVDAAEVLDRGPDQTLGKFSRSDITSDREDPARALTNATLRSR